MIRVLTWDRTRITLIEYLPVPENQTVSINWWNALYRCFTNIRIAYLQRTLPLKPLDNEELGDFLKDMRISTVIGHVEHAEKSSGWVQIYEGKEPFIDEFGEYVYSKSIVTRSGDYDLRYDADRPAAELFKLQYIEHDLSNRRVNREVQPVSDGPLGGLSGLDLQQPGG